MQLSAILPSTKQRASRQARRRSLPLPIRPAAVTGQRPAPRDMRGDGPEDRALYRCGCGYQFTARVTASVGCPHCGTTQAW